MPRWAELACVYAVKLRQRLGGSSGLRPARVESTIIPASRFERVGRSVPGEMAKASFSAGRHVVETSRLAEIRDGRTSPGQQLLPEPMLIVCLAIDW